MIAHRLWVAGRIDQCLIPKLQTIPTIFHPARFQQPPDQRDDMLNDLLPIAGDVIGTNLFNA